MLRPKRRLKRIHYVWQADSFRRRPSEEFSIGSVQVSYLWSATVGFTPPAPGWVPGGTLSLLVARCEASIGGRARRRSRFPIFLITLFFAIEKLVEQLTRIFLGIFRRLPHSFSRRFKGFVCYVRSCPYRYWAFHSRNYSISQTLLSFAFTGIVAVVVSNYFFFRLDNFP